MMPRALVALLLACLMSMAAASKPNHPNAAWGSDARAAIGADIAAVAQAAGMSVEHLEHELGHDNDIGFDKKNKRVLYACEGMVARNITANTRRPRHFHRRSLHASSALPGEPNPTDLSLAFKLHSRPGAPRTLLLDFTGHTTTGTAWNSAFNGGADIVTPPYDIDGIPSSFSDAERTNIIAIWRAVAEDYAAFDVDVTTEEFDAAGNPIPLANVGARAVIGGSSYDWYKAGAGGVAYVGTFGNPTYMPAFIFPAQLGNGYAKYVAEAVSHELGHNMGLSHDGTSTVGYYEGHGNWAPIMGVGYYKPVTTFSKGEYTDANNLQDDLQIISGKMPYRADDHGNTNTTATALAPTPSATDATRSVAVVRGNIERTADSDWFGFVGGAGSATITLALVPNAAANVDLKLEVWAACGSAPLATFNPQGSLLSGANTVSLPADGQYYVAVTGVGDGASASVGYSSYGSLGEYKITVDFKAPPAGFSPIGCTDSPPPPPPTTKQVAIKMTGSTVSYDSRKKLYKVSATLAAVNPADGKPVTGVATSISLRWDSTSSAFKAQTVVLSTSSTTGTVVTNSPTAAKPSTRYTITAVSATGYVYNATVSDVTQTFTF